jgi:hypothetical protein
MNFVKRVLIPILIAWIWISLCEFVRNQFWLISVWTEHYKNMGLIFPTKPINGAVWGIWALVFAILIYFVSKKFTLIQSSIIMWFNGFVLMWLVIGNMNVLPFKILYYAIPFSMIEAFVAVLIIKKLSRN